MVTVVTLRTQRLVLRPWRESDRAPFAAINADLKAMEHFPKTSTREESDTAVDRIVARMEQQGFGLAFGVSPTAVLANVALLGVIGRTDENVTAGTGEEPAERVAMAKVGRIPVGAQAELLLSPSEQGRGDDGGQTYSASPTGPV